MATYTCQLPRDHELAERIFFKKKMSKNPPLPYQTLMFGTERHSATIRSRSSNSNRKSQPLQMAPQTRAGHSVLPYDSGRFFRVIKNSGFKKAEPKYSLGI